MADEVRNSGSRLTPEEIRARREEFKKIQENGHTIELTTQSDKKHSGVSYDYMDRLNKDIEAGIFEDVGHDGFTKNEKRALGNEFDSVFTEHGYSTKFTTMEAGEKYEISYDDYIRLAKAAGYELVKEKAIPENKPADEKSSDNNPPDETVVQTVVTVEIPEDYEVTDVEVRTDSNDGNNVPVEDGTTPVIENKVTIIYENDEDADYVVTDSSEQDSKDRSVQVPNPTPVQDPKKKIAQAPDALPKQAPANKPLVAINNVINEDSSGDALATPTNADASNANDSVSPISTDAPKADNAGQKTENKNKPASEQTYADSEEELIAFFENDEELSGKTNQQRVQIMNQRVAGLDSQISRLERTTETYTTKKVLFFGGKTKTRELPAEVVEARKAQAEQLKADKDNLMRYQVYAKQVLGSEYWNGTFSPSSLKDNNGVVLQEHGTYHEATVTDASGNTRRVIQTRTYEDVSDGQGGTKKGYVNRYYPIDVQKVGDPNIGNGVYWSIVPDKEHELTNVKPVR